MTSTTLLDKAERWAGGAGVLGGIALATAYLLHPPTASPEIVASAFWVAIHVGFMVSLLTGVFLLLALLREYLRSGGGVTGLIGCIIAIVSLVFVFGLDYAEVFIFPTLAIEFPSVVERYGDGTMMPSVAFAFPATGVLFVVGFVLFSSELFRTRAVSRAASLLTLVGTLVFGAGLSGFPPMIVVRLGATIFGAGLVWLGFSLLGKGRNVGDNSTAG